jgi:hypothetical protein
MDRNPGRLNTVGRPIGWRRVTVRDGDGKVLPPRVWGEVVIDMPVWDAAAGDGYLDAPPPLAARFTNGTLWTGDRGKLDGRGFLVLGARHAEILKVGGRSVGARRIEQALRAAVGSPEIAVVGVPDRALGEVPCAVFASASSPTRAAQSSALGAAIALASPSLRPDEVPRWILPRRELARGASGKLRRGMLAAECARWASAFAQLVAPDHRTFAAYAVDPRVAIVDGGVTPWFRAAAPSTGRAVALVTRRPVGVLATAHLEVGATARVVVGPRADAADVAPELLDVFAGELVRLVALLPGDKLDTIYVHSQHAAGLAASGFAPRGDGWLARGDATVSADELAAVLARASDA